MAWAHKEPAYFYLPMSDNTTPLHKIPEGEVADYVDDLKADHQTKFLAGELERIQEKIAETKELAQEEGMAELAEDELDTLRKQETGLIEQLEDIVSEKRKADQYPNQVVLEIRAGAGGDEAALFAEELLSMYLGYCERQGWQAEGLNKSLSDLGGVKEADYELKGKDIYRYLQFETGVHRVQRVPETEKSGRIHTSTASVAVLPIRKHKTINLTEDDVEMNFSRAGGSGGQNVNRRATAVQMTHKETGLQVRCTEGRTQRKNRERALEIMEAKLQQKQREKEERERAQKRQSQIGTGGRSEKIRTYNFPQDRITDHRTGENFSEIPAVLDGELDEIFTHLLTAFADADE